MPYVKIKDMLGINTRLDVPEILTPNGKEKLKADLHPFIQNQLKRYYQQVGTDLVLKERFKRN